MPTAIIYRGQFKNTETNFSNEDNGQIITIDIHDLESGEASESTIVPLQMGDTPFSIEVVDNNEDKFTVFRSKEAIIRVHTSDAIGNETFADGGDNRFKVYIYSPVEMMLIGWLMIADVQEDFQPDPNVLTLSVNDGLGFLSDEELTDLDGNNPQNENSFFEYLIWALAKTGHSLGFSIVFNLRESAAVPISVDTEAFGHFFNTVFLNARTFESGDVGVSLNCREVIERMFGEQAFIQQKNGLWHIMRVDEMQIDHNNYVWKFDPDGVFISSEQLAYEKSIGAASPMRWMNDDASVFNERIHKLVKHTYKYETGRELICNLEFERGTGPEVTGAETETIDYEPECIQFFRNNGLLVDVDPVSGSVGVLRKYYENGYEKDRYLVSKTAGGFPHYFKLSPLYVEEGDRVRLSISHRFNTDESAVSSQVASVKLYGDDGTIWDWEYDTTTSTPTNQWVLSSASTFTNNWTDNVSGLDNREWKSIGTTSNNFPVSGNLVIRLYNQLAPPVEMWYNNVEVDYIPKINGSYQKYTGHTHTTTQPTDPEKYKSIRDKQVYINDAPKKVFKGALLKKGTSVNLLTSDTTVGNLGEFEVSGNYKSVFRPGMRLSINGAFVNNTPPIETKILSVSYSLVGDVTTIYTDADTTAESVSDVSFFLETFTLTEGFYRANLEPEGTENAIPFGEIQNGDVWNQFNRTMRKFEGTVDKLQTSSIVPDLSDKYFLTDANPNTNNKAFQLLHHKQDFHLCEWDVFFHEVHDSTKTKEYNDHAFKYITG